MADHLLVIDEENGVITAYNVVGEQTFHMDGATGDVLIAGALLVGGTIRTADPTEGETRVEITDSVVDKVYWKKVISGVDTDIAYVGTFLGGNLEIASLYGVKIMATTDATLEAVGDVTLRALDELKVDSAKLGFFNKTPVTKRTDPGDHAGLTSTGQDGNARIKINQILQILRDYGMI